MLLRRGRVLNDFRYASLLTVGLILIFTGTINFLASWWIKGGHMGALAASGTATLFLCTFLVILHPAANQAFPIILHGIYLGLLVMRWKARDLRKPLEAEV